MQDGRAIAISGSPDTTSRASSVSLREAANSAQRNQDEPPRELRQGPNPQHAEKQAVDASLAPQLAVVFQLGAFHRDQIRTLARGAISRLVPSCQREVDHDDAVPGKRELKPGPVVLHMPLSVRKSAAQLPL